MRHDRHSSADIASPSGPLSSASCGLFQFAMRYRLPSHPSGLFMAQKKDDIFSLNPPVIEIERSDCCVSMEYT